MSLALALLVFANGCASHRDYFVDRERDLADVFTLCVGVGVGAHVRTGPLVAGACLNTDVFGLRGGMWNPTTLHDYAVYDWILTIGGIEGFMVGDHRGKAFITRDDFPILMMVDTRSLREVFHDPTLGGADYSGRRLFHPFYTQIEAAGGFVSSFRIGFNPGELADLLLGWFGVDFFGDDIEMVKNAEDLETISKKARPSEDNDRAKVPERN